MKHRITVILLFLLIPLSAIGQQYTATGTVHDLDSPPLFGFGTWNNKIRVDNGAWQISGVNGQGGGGFNVQLDLLRHADETPAIRVRVGAENKAPSLRLMLIDDAGVSATWWFSLKDVKVGTDTTIAAREGASLAESNDLGKAGVKPDLSQVRQVQLQGDWSAKDVDVQVDSIVLLKPDSTILAARKARTDRLAGEAAALKKERDDLRARYGRRTAASPRVEHVYAAAPDLIAVQIRSGEVTPAKLLKYEPQPNDQRREETYEGVVSTVVLVRDGKEIGWLTGPNWEWLCTYEGFEGDPLLEFLIDDASNYTITSADDSNFTNALAPIVVHRKSKPINWAQGPSPAKLVMLHTIYLKTPRPLAVGKAYNISFGPLNTSVASFAFVHDPMRVRSEAVHSQQVGYRPSDPVKRAYVSEWLGTGGALTLPEQLSFRLVDDTTGKTVFEGKSDQRWPADKPEQMRTSRNFNGTDVVRLDFSSFSAPGRYRVVVDGVGCSYPFEITDDVWKRAFVVQMRGLFNNRSGMALGPPYTDFVKPRDMHPDDGYSVTRSTAKRFDGISMLDLPKTDTGIKVNGWGGYHDAGDWNPRRVTHMRVTLAQLELIELFPEYFKSIELNIPKRKGVPDLITEAMWELDCFTRLQGEDGGVPFEMESRGDPGKGEVSWTNRLPTYVYAADCYGSWYYAAVAARMARVVKPFSPIEAEAYLASAKRAFDFAEKDHAATLAAGKSVPWEATDARNLAAVELLRTTGDKSFHAIFLENSSLMDETPDLYLHGKAVQRDQAFAYALLPDSLSDAKLKRKAIAAIEREAVRAIEYAGGNAFSVTNQHQAMPQFLSFYTSSGQGMELARAHYLTKKPEYLAALVQATQFQLGLNPSNLVYTTGLGTNPVLNPLKLDSRRTGQPVPEGITVAGNIDYKEWSHQNWVSWPVTWVFGNATTPHPYEWPTHEAYFDLHLNPAMNEFCVDWWAPNIFNWGYLAARP